MNWGGAFAKGSWERGASDSEGEDNSPSGRSTTRRPLSAQLMVKVANWDTEKEDVAASDLLRQSQARASSRQRGGAPLLGGVFQGNFEVQERIPTSPRPAPPSARPSTAPVKSKKLIEKWGHLRGSVATHETVTEEMRFMLDRLHTLKGKTSRSKHSEAQMRHNLSRGLPRKRHDPTFDGTDHGVMHLKRQAERELLSKKIPALMCVMERRISGSCMNLTNSNISSKLLETMKASLLKHPEVSELRLLDNNLGQDFCPGLVEVLQETQNIKNLNLSRNKFRATDVKVLSKLMNHSKFLDPLRKQDEEEYCLPQPYATLSEEEEEAELRAEKQARRLAQINEAISEGRFQDLRLQRIRNFFIHTLNLSHNPIGCKGAAQLAKALMRNKIVTDLDLSGCGIGREGLRPLSEAVTKNDSLRLLNLSWNKFGDTTSGVCIAAMIARNQTLTNLILNMVGLSDRQGVSLAKAIAEDAGLRELRLTDNKLGPHFSHALGESLRKNSHLVLELLDISMNPLSFHGAQEIMSAYSAVLQQKDSKLRYINIEGCLFHHDVAVMEYYKQALTSCSADAEEGWYRLDLAVPAQRDAAESLAKVWNKSGERTWEYSSFNGRPFNLSQGLNWPKRMPKKGVLIVDFHPPRDFPMDSGLEPMPEDVFDYFWCLAEGSNDSWKIAVMKLLCYDFWFTCAQAKKIISSFTMSQLRLLAGQCVLSRIVDSGEMHNLKVAFLDDEWERIVRFHGSNQEFIPNNPTGHYKLSLSLGLGLHVLNQLKKHTLRQEREKVWVGDRLYYNLWRDVKINGEVVPRDIDFARHEFPPDAEVELSYVSHMQPLGEHIPPLVLQLVCKLLSEDFESYANFKKRVLRELRFYRKITTLDAMHGDPDEAAASVSHSVTQESTGVEGKPNLMNLTINQKGEIMSSIRWLASFFAYKCDDAVQILKHSARSTDDIVKVGLSMYSRITDKHQFKMVLKEMPFEACHRVMRHIGHLRVIHAPTAYGLYFKLRLSIPEEREYCSTIVKHVVRYRGTAELVGLRLNGNLIQNVSYDSGLWGVISGNLYEQNKTDEGSRSRSGSGVSNVVEFLLQGPDKDGRAIQSAIRIQAQWRKWVQRKIFFRKKIASLTIKIHLFRKIIIVGKEHRAEVQRKIDVEESRKKMRKMWAQRMRCNLSLAVHRQETIIRSYYVSGGKKIGSVIRGNLVSMEHMKRGTSKAENWSHGKEPGQEAMERKKSICPDIDRPSYNTTHII